MTDEQAEVLGRRCPTTNCEACGGSGSNDPEGAYPENYPCERCAGTGATLWRSGVLFGNGCRVLGIDPEQPGCWMVADPVAEGCTIRYVWPQHMTLGNGWWPDFRDPATLGCLVAEVRERWGDPDELWGGWLECHRDHHALWVVVQPHHVNGALHYRSVGSMCGSEAEAWIAALEAAP